MQGFFDLLWRRSDATEADSILWAPDAKICLIRKDADAGKRLKTKRKYKRMTENADK